MARRRSDIGPRIVEAARGRFLREGVDGASLRAIASDARTSIGMVYYYFPTKDDLFFAVVEETYAHLVDDMAAACAPDVAPDERFRRLFRRVGAMTERESLTVRLIVREVLVSSKRLRRLFARFQRGHFPVVLRTIADGMGDGTLRRDLPPMLVLVLALSIGAFPQFVLHQIGDRFELAVPRGDALADTLVDVLLHGLGGAAQAARPSKARRKRVSAAR